MTGSKKSNASTTKQTGGSAPKLPKTKTRKRTKKISRAVLEGRAGVGTSPAQGAGGAAKPNRGTLGLMKDKLGQADAGVGAYMMGLTTPTLPCRPPWCLGDFELDTNTYSYVFQGTFACTAAGFGYLSCMQDSWLESGNDAGPNNQYCCYTTGGYPVWYSPAGSTATVTVPVGVASSADHAKLQLPKLDQAFTGLTRYRMTAMILSVWPESPATTTSGTLSIAAIGNEQALGDGALNNVNFATIVGYPQEYVQHAESPLPNWDSKMNAHAVGVPFSENCFTFQYVIGTGQATSGTTLMVAAVSGAASGQVLRFRVEYKYETTAPITYQTGLENSIGAVRQVPKETLLPHLAALRPMTVGVHPPAALPAKGVKAMQTADPGMASNFISAGASALGKTLASAVKSGVKALPYVGGFLGNAWDAIFG